MVVTFDDAYLSVLDCGSPRPARAPATVFVPTDYPEGRPMASPRIDQWMEHRAPRGGAAADDLGPDDQPRRGGLGDRFAHLLALAPHAARRPTSTVR